jgi:hypothetical protein
MGPVAANRVPRGNAIKPARAVGSLRSLFYSRPAKSLVHGALEVLKRANGMLNGHLIRERRCTDVSHEIATMKFNPNLAQRALSEGIGADGGMGLGCAAYVAHNLLYQRGNRSYSLRGIPIGGLGTNGVQDIVSIEMEGQC